MCCRYRKRSRSVVGSKFKYPLQGEAALPGEHLHTKLLPGDRSRRSCNKSVVRTRLQSTRLLDNACASMRNNASEWAASGWRVASRNIGRHSHLSAARLTPILHEPTCSVRLSARDSQCSTPDYPSDALIRDCHAEQMKLFPAFGSRVFFNCSHDASWVH